MDLEIEQYLCHGGGRHLQSIGFLELLEAVGMQCAAQGEVTRHKLDWSLWVRRTMYRLGWCRKVRGSGVIFVRGHVETDWPRPCFGTVLSRRAVDVLNRGNGLSLHAITPGQLAELVDAHGLGDAMVRAYLRRTLLAMGWRPRPAVGLAKGVSAEVFMRPTGAASTFTSRQQIIDAASRGRFNYGKRERRVAHHDTAGGRDVCNGRRGLTMR